jgi:ribose transport system substrate-binding protein
LLSRFIVRSITIHEYNLLCNEENPVKNKFPLFYFIALLALFLSACTPTLTPVPPTAAPAAVTASADVKAAEPAAAPAASTAAPSSNQEVMSVPVITKADKAYNIGLVFKGLTNEASKQMEADAQKHAESIGVKLTSQGLQDDSDIEGQVNIIENMIAKKMDAIVVAPTDAKALVPPVVKAVKAGIVVINVDSRLDQDLLKSAGVEIPYIGPDNEAAAKMSGDELGKLLKAGDKVVILEGAPGAENGNQRKQGFMDTVNQYKLDLVDSETARWDTEPAFTLVSNLLTAHPDIVGIMAANDNMALGAIQAIDAAGKTGKVQVVGFDNISAAQKAIKDGKMIATIEGYMGDVSSHGIDAAVAKLQGTALSSFVKTDVKLITAADLKAAEPAAAPAASTAAPSSNQEVMSVPVITKADKAYNIGLVFKGLTNEASKQMEADAQKHAESIGVKLTSQGLQDDSDIEGQVNIIENMIAKKMDAIVVAPTDAKALVPPVVKAVKAGIVVINVDSRLDQDLLKSAGVEIPYIGPDNEAAAKMSGDELGKLLKAGDKVVILEGAPGAENGNQRKQGFMDTVNQYKLDLVDSETARWDTEPAFTLVSNLLTAHPDIVGIMAANDNMALGAIQAIDAVGKTGKVQVVGFDNISAAQKAIKDGKMIATIEGFMGDVSSHGIDAAVAKLQGTTLSSFVKTDVKLITAADLK